MKFTFVIRSVAILGFVCVFAESSASAQLWNRHGRRSVCASPAGPVCVLSGGQPSARANLSASDAQGDFAPNPPEQPAQDFDRPTVEQQLRYAMRTDPVLRGAWLHLVDFAPGDDLGGRPSTYTFRRVLDRSRAAEQTAAMDRLIAAWVPRSSIVVFNYPNQSYPFSELLKALQERIDVDPQLDGCLVEDGYYAADDNDPSKLNLMLRGRIANGEQNSILEAACTNVMRNIPAWVSPRMSTARQVSFAPNDATELNTIVLAIFPSAKDVKVVPSARDLANKWYVLGLKHFSNAQYADAARAFQLAVVEAPDSLEMRYWRITSELAQGHTETAYRQMRSAIKNPNVHQYSVHKMMERVQGDLRHDLRQLEQRVMFSRTRGDF